MKTTQKLALFLATIVCSVFSTKAQITSREVSEKKEEIPVYDSIQDAIHSTTVKQFVGQTIYIVPKSKLNKNNDKDAMLGYSSFLTSPQHYVGETNAYKPVKIHYSYGSGFDGKVTDYTTLVGKYFKITEYIDHNDREQFPNLEDQGYFLKLEGQENHDVVYYFLGEKPGEFFNWSHDAFIFPAVFEKGKQMYKGKKFIVGHRTNLTDLNSGNSFNCPAGFEWTCTDVTIIDTEKRNGQIPVLIFKDSASHEIAVGFSPQTNEYDLLYVGSFKSKDLVLAELKKKDPEKKELAKSLKLRKAELVKNYGANDGTLISEGKVAVGMTKEMCIQAMGYPDYKNVNTVNNIKQEQYNYGLKTFLYFEDGILTAVKNY